jgi:hypothetical protein
VTHLGLDLISERDDTIPSIVVWKRKRRSGLRFSSKKDLKGIRLAKLNAKGPGRDLTSVTKTLANPNLSPIEGCAFDLQDCAPGSDGPTLLESVDELDEKRT